MQAIGKAEAIMSPLLVTEYIKFYSKGEQEQKNWQARYFPDTAAITDPTVQACYRPISAQGTLLGPVSFMLQVN